VPPQPQTAKPRSKRDYFISFLSLSLSNNVLIESRGERGERGKRGERKRVGDKKGSAGTNIFLSFLEDRPTYFFQVRPTYFAELFPVTFSSAYSRSERKQG
jgi:hypothetical protein